MFVSVAKISVRVEKEHGKVQYQDSCKRAIRAITAKTARMVVAVAVVLVSFATHDLFLSICSIAVKQVGFLLFLFNGLWPITKSSFCTESADKYVPAYFLNKNCLR